MPMVATTSDAAPDLFISDRETSSADASPAGCVGAGAAGLAALLRQAPPVVVAGRAAILPAIAYRLLRQRTRLLMWADAAPRFWQVQRRLALHIADALLVGDETAQQEVTRAGKPASAVFNVPGPYAIDGFLNFPAGRPAEAAYRVVVCGGLTPNGDGINILGGAAAWAERYPCRRLELCWVGNGDLRGVLAAQSLPDNLVQHFAGGQDLAGMAGEFLRSGLLIAGAPARADLACRGELLAQAMASGLVVLFDRNCPVASRLLRHGLTGIGYQAGEPDGLSHVLGEVMDMPAGELDQIRNAARMRVLPMNRQGFEERLWRAVESVMRDAGHAQYSGQHGGRSFLPPPILQAR